MDLEGAVSAQGTWQTGDKELGLWKGTQKTPLSANWEEQTLEL